MPRSSETPQTTNRRQPRDTDEFSDVSRHNFARLKRKDEVIIVDDDDDDGHAHSRLKSDTTRISSRGLASSGTNPQNSSILNYGRGRVIDLEGIDKGTNQLRELR